MDASGIQGTVGVFSWGNRHMNNESGSVGSDTDDDDFDEFEDNDMTDTVVIADSDTTDNVGDSSVEINVEELIADVEGTDDKVSARQKEVRRRLEELAEQKALEDTYAIDFDED